MKLKTLFALMTLLFLSCEKTDPINTEEVRLLQLKMAPSNGNTNSIIFDYDNQGRITRISNKLNDNPPTVMGTVSYSGNEVLFTETPVSNPASSHTRQIKFVIDGSNKPLTRIVQVTNEYFPPNNPQYDTYSDTATYTYDTQGLLLRKTGSSRDSVWYNPGVAQITITTKTYTADYTNAGGNLAEISKVTRAKDRFTTPTGTRFSEATYEEKITYEYTRSYVNQTDFRNAFLLDEFAFLFTDYPLNKGYKNLPEKLNSTLVTRNASGAVVNTETNSGTITLGYNKYGFLSSIGEADKTEFIYSR